MKNLILIFLVLSCGNLLAQSKTADENKEYHATPAKINDLVHTKLDVHFDFARSWMYGKAWITVHPHFYPTDSLNLDAKGMRIEEVGLMSGNKSIPLKYTYDSMNLRIILDRTYRAKENYVIFIKYTAKPNGYKAEVSSMMPGEKGLYFINPGGEIKGKPTQIWTQGETEANSYWFPTIDKPNQKTTNEIIMTVPSRYVTLSNGILTSQKTNGDGTRTDTWKMNLPHAPYLLFMGVGEYSIIKDQYKGKEVSYYVEKEYAPYARKIFGNTPEMIAYFSRITGVDYPWPKYAQITGRDYIFGAMENTSATLHAEQSQLDARELTDGNSWEDVISHELFHQWFGDYVTTESWSNITVNESFADYGETLWNEYKYGKESGQATIYNDRRNYLGNPDNAALNLVRFNYKNVFEAFDGVSYQKGGNILHMLRNYVGDSAFFRSINLYLTANKFKSAEAHNLRLAFEEITGQDLNWFFDQWYYNSGHPKLDISYDYDAREKTARVFMRQTQEGKNFRLPFKIDVYEGSDKKRYSVWMDHVSDTFSFAVNRKPDLINVDADKVLLSEKNDHKSAENFIHQYKVAGSYIDRREAIAYFLNNRYEPKAMEFTRMALKDKNEKLRRFLLQQVAINNDTVRRAVEKEIADLAKNDPKPLVRADAIEDLGRYNDVAYKPLFMKAVYDSSYTVAGKALTALSKLDSVAALNIARSLMTQPAKGNLQYAIINILSTYGSGSANTYIYEKFNQGDLNTRLDMLSFFTAALIKDGNNQEVKKQADVLINNRDELPAFMRSFIDPVINGSLTSIATAKRTAGSTDIADYIQSKLPAIKPADKGMDIAAGELQKYTGEYSVNNISIKISVRDQVLYALIPGQPEYTLVPLEQHTFGLQSMPNYKMQFHLNDKGVVTELLSIQPNGTFSAIKTK